MTVVDSLPDRPLTDAEVSKLNRSDPVTLAVAVAFDEPGGKDTPDGQDASAGRSASDEGRGLVLATDEWVRGLAFGDDHWTAVESVAYGEGTERYEALRDCETAVREWLDGRE
ncbi:hypothetical protein RYH80_01525 [Halobaculum sp. MBLA0147]|uniref:hypothetical protein n=1 Tax=Halobaculum sp. MBLA0147 TaxID=3079934 RepID=UPI0035257695